MLIFSPKARQLIDEAVTLLDLPQQQDWAAWSAEHPGPRRAGRPSDDGQGPLPRGIAGVILAALEAQRVRMQERLGDQLLSEDDISDLDNDISQIRAVERAIYENIRLPRAVA